MDAVPRRTLVVTALGVGVAALAIGWMVGRSGEGGDATATGATTATTVQVTTTERVADTIAPPPTTARPRPSTTTTTTIPAGTPVDIPLDPYLRALPYELAVKTETGRILRFDLAAGVARAYPSTRNEESFVEFTSDGSVLEYSPWAASLLRTIARDGTTIDLLSGTSEIGRSPQIVVDGAGQVWLVRRDDTAIAIFDGEVAILGDPVALPVGAVDRGGLVGDPSGGLLAWVASDMFEIETVGPTRITTGEITALGVDSVIVNECDESLVCGYVMIDRATGERRALPLQEIIDQATPPLAEVASGARTTIQWGGYWQSRATVAGNTAVFGISTTDGTTYFGGGLAVIDLVEQRVVGVLPDTFGPVALSADGSWVFASQSPDGLVAFEVATGDTYDLGDFGAQQFTSIAIRTT